MYPTFCDFLRPFFTVHWPTPLSINQSSNTTISVVSNSLSTYLLTSIPSASFPLNSPAQLLLPSSTRSLTMNPKNPLLNLYTKVHRSGRWCRGFLPVFNLAKSYLTGEISSRYIVLILSRSILVSWIISNVPKISPVIPGLLTIFSFLSSADHGFGVQSSLWKQLLRPVAAMCVQALKSNGRVLCECPWRALGGQLHDDGTQSKAHKTAHSGEHICTLCPETATFSESHNSSPCCTEWFRDHL